MRWFSLFLLMLPSTVLSQTAESTNPQPQWFRGNTHVHTVLSGHADSTPEDAAKWYLDRDYNFVILSEHNQFIDPETVALPKDRRKNFILIPGEEITGRRAIHTTGMNLNGLVDWKVGDVSKSGAMQRHADGAIEAGGQPILNHPKWRWALRAKDIIGVKRLHMFELYNGAPEVNNFGDDEHPSTEEMWDTLLTAGMLMYGVSADDAHVFEKISPKESNPGRGWVMVRARTLDADSITDAMASGDFYASNGVFLNTYERGPGEYVVEADVERTAEELTSAVLRGRQVKYGDAGYRIDFIGPDGRVLETIKGTNGRHKISNAMPFVRAKVTFTRAFVTDDGSDEFEEYYAWGQPVFSDDRAANTQR